MLMEKTDRLFGLSKGENRCWWLAPWSGQLLGFLSQWPVQVHSVYLGLSCVASDNLGLCAEVPSLYPLAADITAWCAPRPLPVKVGQLCMFEFEPLKLDCEFTLQLARKVPAALAPNDLIGVSSTQSEAYTQGPSDASARQALRAAKRARQVGECLAVLQQPYEKKRYR